MSLFRRAARARITAPLDDAESPSVFPWRLRVALLVGSALLFVLAWLGWARATREALDRAVAGLRARGEPVLAEEFAERPVESRENAVVLLRRAAEALSFGEDEGTHDWREQTFPEPLASTAVPRLARLLEDNRESLRLVREARGLGKISWGFDSREAARLDARGLLSDQWVWGYRLEHLLICGFLHAWATGDHAGAVERLRDLLCLGRIVARQPSVEEYEVAWRSWWDAAERTEAVAPHLRIGDGAGAASRAQVAALVLELNDVDASHQQCVRAVKGQRALVLERTALLASGQTGRYDFVAHEVSPGTTRYSRRYAPAPLQSLSGRLFAPYYRAKTVGHLDRVTVAGAAAAIPDLPSANGVLGPAPPPRPFARGAAGAASGAEEMFGVGWAVELFNFSPAETMRRIIELEFVHATARRMAAVLLAVRLYEIDHPGDLPARLDDLVPAYLPTPPADPHAAGGRLLGYARAAPGGPFIYSVWRNGVDDVAAGRWAPPPNRETQNRWGQPDYFMPVPVPSVPVPATGNSRP